MALYDPVSPPSLCPKPGLEHQERPDLEGKVGSSLQMGIPASFDCRWVKKALFPHKYRIEQFIGPGSEGTA